MKSQQQQPSKGQEGNAVRKHRFIGDFQIHHHGGNSSGKRLETMPSYIQDDSVMEFERTEQEVYMSSQKQPLISSSNSQVEDPSSSMPTPLTFREQHYDADTDSSQIQGLKAHAAALIPPMTSEDDQTMSLISDATIIFNNTESGVVHSGYDAGLLAAASSLFHQQLQRQLPQNSEIQSTTLMLEDLGGVTAMQVFQDITSSAQNVMGERDEMEEGGPSQQNSSYIEQPSRCSSRLESTQNQDLSMISSQLSKTMPAGTSPTKAQLASKAKHEQRRQNLRKKRVQEQIMQVVEGFIREQTILTTVQGFVEANMLNDMMNVEHEILNKVIQQELRRIIRGILSDIYFAHISSLFIENFIQGELLTLGQDLLYEEERLTNSASLMILPQNLSQDDYFQSTSAIQILDQEGGDDDESSLNNTETQMIMACPSKQVREIQQSYQSNGNAMVKSSQSEELSIDVVSEGLKREEMADVVLGEIGENLIKQALLSYTQEALAFHLFQTCLSPSLSTSLYTSSVTSCLSSLTSTLRDTLLSKLQAAHDTQRLAFEAARYAREQACVREASDQLVGEWVDRETTGVFKAEVEGEYFGRLIYEEVLALVVEEVALGGYEDEIVAEQMVSEIIDSNIEEVVVSTINQEEQKAQLATDLQQSIVDTQVKGSSIDLVLDLILEDFLQVFAQTTLSSKSLDDLLLCEDLFSDLVGSVLKKEVGFILQLERDAQAIYQALISSQLEEPSIESFTLSKKEEEVQTDTLQEVFIVSSQEEVTNLKILRQASSEEAKRQNDRYGRRPIGAAKTPTHAMISLRDSVEVEDLWAKNYCQNLIEGGVRVFIQDILISLVLPHQIYKRIMTRTLRKTTYAAIQQAVDIAYKLEEDTINVADTLLDRFVESQIREMVMLYPTAKNHQRRSHTILIDASNDKFRIGKSPQAPPTQNESEGRSRERNAGGSLGVPQTSLFNQKRHSIEMNQSQEGFVNNIDAKYSSHQTQNSVGKSNIENQPVMMKKYHQTMPNQRYNNQNIHKQASSLGTTSQPFMEEELPSTTLHMIDVLPSVHFTHHLTHEDISFQQVADHACLSGPAKQAILPSQLQAAYKTQSTSSAGIFHTLDQNRKSVSSSQDTRIADPAQFKSLRGLEKKRRSLEKHKSSLQSSEGGLMEPVEDVEIPVGHLGKLISPRINEQLLSSNRGNDSKRAPKEGFKFIETKNSMLAASQRSQEQLQIYPQLIMNTMDTRNANPLTMLTTSNVVYKPQVNQFDTFSSGSPGHGGLVNRNIPHVSLTLVGNQLQGTTVQNSQRKSVNGIVQARSPQNHGRYFNDQSEVKSIKPQREEPRGRSTSNRRAVIDLRGAIAQIQTAQKAIQPLIDHEGGKQLFTQTKRHQVDLRDSKSFVQNSNQRPNSAFGPATSFVKTTPQIQPLQPQHLPHHTPIITETSIKTQLQQLIMILKGRVTDCKAKTVQQSNHLTTGGPSTSLLMTQLACDVLHSLAEQVLAVTPQRDPLIDLRDLNLEDSSINKTVTARIREEEEEPLSEQAKCREQLFVIDKKIKELVMKLQQNQSLMSKQDFQLCMLQANQLAMLNCQKLTLIMRDLEENHAQSFESINFPSHNQTQSHPHTSHTTKQPKGKQNVQPVSSIHGVNKSQAQKQHQNRSTTSGGSGVSTPNVSSFLKSHANQQQPLQMRQLNYNYAQIPQQRR